MAGAAGPFIQVHLARSERHIWLNAAYIKSITTGLDDDPTTAGINLVDQEDTMFVQEAMDDVAAMANGAPVPQQRPMAT